MIGLTTGPESSQTSDETGLTLVTLHQARSPFLSLIARSHDSTGDARDPWIGVIGGFRFVGSGGDPFNTLEPLNVRPGIFGGLVIIASRARRISDAGPRCSRQIRHHDA